jgi:hypothetical protein
VSGVTGQEMDLYATTVQEVLDLYRSARPTPGGS